MREMQATYSSRRRLLQIQFWSILNFGVIGTLPVHQILEMINQKMTFECSKCDCYLQFSEELQFKYYNSTDLLLLDRLLWNGCCGKFVEKTSWVFTSNDPDEFGGSKYGWFFVTNTKWCQRFCRFRFCYVLYYGGWSLMCFVIIFFDHLTNRWLMKLMKNCHFAELP